MLCIVICRASALNAEGSRFSAQHIGSKKDLSPRSWRVNTSQSRQCYTHVVWPSIGSFTKAAYTAFQYSRPLIHVTTSFTSPSLDFHEAVATVTHNFYLKIWLTHVSCDHGWLIFWDGNRSLILVHTAGIFIGLMLAVTKFRSQFWIFIFFSGLWITNKWFFKINNLPCRNRINVGPIVTIPLSMNILHCILKNWQILSTAWSTYGIWTSQNSQRSTFRRKTCYI